MSWHYSNDGQQIGPIEDGEFQALVRNGTIHQDTLVWKDGLSQWTKYGELSQQQEGGVALATAGRCAECGHEFPQEEMVNLAGSWVCGGCKAQHVQKLKEGVQIGSGFEFAGFWIRVGAKIIDGILLRLIGMGLGFVVGLVMKSSDPRSASVAVMCSALLGIAVQVAYEVFFLGKFGATLGKMAVKVKVVRSNGEPITYLRALGRYFAQILSGLLLGIGYLMVAWDPEKRALHDRICDTRVIKQR